MIIIFISLLISSCTYLSEHPKVEEELEKVGEEIIEGAAAYESAKMAKNQ